MVFKPFEIYHEKKSKSEDNQVEGGDSENLEQSITEYLNLSDKKRFKYIKKAERKYDEHIEANPGEKTAPFSEYLTKTELTLLMKSYNIPEKPAP
jgi:hypothetical protein